MEVFSLNWDLRIFETGFSDTLWGKTVRAFDFSGRHGLLGPIFRVEMDTPARRATSKATWLKFKENFPKPQICEEL